MAVVVVLVGCTPASVPEPDAGEGAPGADAGLPDAGEGSDAGQAGPPVRLDLEPSALLLPAIGATATLTVKAFDADGREVPATGVTFSSGGGKVAVDAQGVVTGQALGVERVSVTLGTLHARSSVLVAVPTPGALLVRDDQVTGTIRPIDAQAVFGVGYRYEVGLTGVTPAVGNLVIGTGALPVGGRVVAVDGALVTLELVALDELFPDLVLDETITLADEPFELNPGVADSFDVVEQPSGAFSFALKPGVTLTGSRRKRSRGPSGKFSFDVGPVECTVETSAFQLSLAKLEFTLDPGLSIERKWNSSLKRVVVTSNARAAVTVKPVLQSQLEGKLTCELEVGKRHIPLPGPVGLALGFAVPFGVGFEVEAKVPLNVGVSLELKREVTAVIKGGVTCAATCDKVAEFTDTSPAASGVTAQVATLELTPALKAELSAYAYAFAKVEFGGSQLVRSVGGAAGFRQFGAELVVVKAGLKLEGKFADQEAQAADPAFASEYRVLFEAGLEPGSAVEAFIGFVKITVAKLELKFTQELATSPKGSFTVMPARFVATDPLAFRVTFRPDSLSFPLIGFNAVKVSIYKKTITGGLVLVAQGPITMGMTEVNLSAIATEAGSDADFAAFVETGLLGPAMPLEVELACTVPAGFSYCLVDLQADLAPRRRTASGSIFGAGPLGMAVWKAGVVTVLPMHSAGTSNPIDAIDYNDLHQALYSYSYDQEAATYLVADDGSEVTINLFEGRVLNQRGAVLGDKVVLESSPGAEDGYRLPALFDLGLTLISPMDFQPRALTDTGMAVGCLGTSSVSYQPATVPGGTLPLPPGTTAGCAELSNSTGTLFAGYTEPGTLPALWRAEPDAGRVAVPINGYATSLNSSGEVLMGPASILEPDGGTIDLNTASYPGGGALNCVHLGDDRVVTCTFLPDDGGVNTLVILKPVRP